MSILRLESTPGGTIDSRFITSVDTVIQNLGPESFDILMQVFKEGNPLATTLHHVPAFSSTALPWVETERTGFNLLLVTNINSYASTGITMNARLYGEVVAVYSQEHFQRVH